MVKGSLQTIYVVVFSALLILFIILLMSKIYTMETRLKTAETSISTLNGLVEEFLDLIRRSKQKNSSDIEKIEKEKRGIAVKKTENTTELLVSDSGKDVTILKYIEGDASQPDHVEICGMTFLNYADGIVIRDSETGSEIPISSNSKKLTELIDNTYNLSREFSAIRDNIPRIDTNITRISTDLGNKASTSDFEKFTARINSDITRISMNLGNKASISDFEKIIDRIVFLESNSESKNRLIEVENFLNTKINQTRDQEAKLFTDHLETLSKNFDEITRDLEKRIGTIDPRIEFINSSLSELERKGNAHLKCVLKVSLDGKTTILNSNVETVNVESIKEKGRSIYAIFFDQEFTKKIPLVSIIPISQSAANSYIVNIVKITEKYVQYRTSSHITGNETDVETYVTIESL